MNDADTSVRIVTRVPIRRPLAILTIVGGGHTCIERRLHFPSGENVSAPVPAVDARGENTKALLGALVARGENASAPVPAVDARGENTKALLGVFVARGENASAPVPPVDARGENTKALLGVLVARGENVSAPVPPVDPTTSSTKMRKTVPQLLPGGSAIRTANRSSSSLFWLSLSVSP